MAGTPSRWPWRMGLLWLCTFVALLTWLPGSCRTIPCRDRTSLLGLSPEGRFVAVANVRGRIPDSSYGDLTTIDLSTGIRREIPTDLSPSLKGTVSRVLLRGNRLWVDGSTGPADQGALAAFDLTTGQEVESGWVQCIDGLSGLTLSRDGKRAMTLNLAAGPQLSVWDVDAGRALCSIEEAGTERSLSDDGTLVATFSREIRADLEGHDLRWSVYDAATGRLKAQRTERRLPYDGSRTPSAIPSDKRDRPDRQRGFDVSTAIRFSDGNRTILSGTTQDCVIWHWQTGLVTRDPGLSSGLAARRRFESRVESEDAVWALTPDGRWAIATSKDRTWHDAIVLRLSGWFPRTMAGTPLDGGVVRLWNVQEDCAVITMPSAYNDIALSDSGEYVVRLRNRELEIWTNPPRRQWVLSFCASLLIPVFWLLRRRAVPLPPESSLQFTGSSHVTEATGTVPLHG